MVVEEGFETPDLVLVRVLRTVHTVRAMHPVWLLSTLSMLSVLTCWTMAHQMAHAVAPDVASKPYRMISMQRLMLRHVFCTHIIPTLARQSHQDGNVKFFAHFES